MATGAAQVLRWAVLSTVDKEQVNVRPMKLLNWYKYEKELLGKKTGYQATN